MKQFRASIFYILSTLEFLTAIKVYVNDIIDVAVSFYFCSLYYISCYLSRIDYLLVKHVQWQEILASSDRAFNTKNGFPIFNF